jgi:predicted nucleotidyltransferase
MLTTSVIADLFHPGGVPADVRSVLDELVRDLREAVPRQLVGVYVQGSFALGAADEHSDVDLVVATRRRLGRDEVARLQALHDRIFDLPGPWAQRLEGSYFPLAVLRHCTRRGEDLWYLDNGARRLVDPVPTSLLRTEAHASIRALEGEIVDAPDPSASRFYQGFAVLNACRMWCDFVTGEAGSKRRGAEWARARLDASWADLIERAWETRPDPATSVRTAADPADLARTRDLVLLVAARCEADAQALGLATTGADDPASPDAPRPRAARPASPRASGWPRRDRAPW